MQEFEPAYIETARQGKLKDKVQQAFDIIRECTLCPRNCGVDRLSDQTGVCRTGARARVSSFGPHFGEEEPLVGDHGSGTIFFTFCNLLCIFCQNADISHKGDGDPATAEQLAQVMLHLQKQGCHNINLVTPSHVVPQILAALEIAADQGLCLPLVYNSGAYDKVETLKLLDGVVDIYMPDFKFWDPQVAEQTCDAPDYPEVARQALTEMHRQVGDLTINRGLAQQGLLIRHLVLPEGLAGTPEVMRFIAEKISPDSYVNIMPQYRPLFRASEVKALARHPSRQEFEAARAAAIDAGLHRLDRRTRVFMFG